MYLPGQFGVALGDVVACTGDGGRRLNSSAYGLTIVE
jgi:hypothetical protein